MSPTRQLYELQQAELDARQRRDALATVEAELNNNQAVAQASSRADEARKDLEALQGEQRDLELSTSGLDSQLQEVEKKLYGGATTNPKELMGFQADAGMLRRRKGEQEDRLLELMLKVDETRGNLDGAQEELRSVEAQWGTEHERLAREKERLSQEAAQLEQQQEELVAGLDPKELSLYRTLQASRGASVAKVEGGMCRGCGLTLPSHELQRARSGQELVRCSSCGRILYVS